LLRIVVKKEDNSGYATRGSFSGLLNIYSSSNTGNPFAKAYGKRLAKGDSNTGGEGLGFCFVAIPNNYSAFLI
jgi:hypothetical protein